MSYTPRHMRKKFRSRGGSPDIEKKRAFRRAAKLSKKFIFQSASFLERPDTNPQYQAYCAAVGDGSVRVYVRPIVTVQAQKDACPAVVTGELLDREGINGIIVYDSHAFADPWLAK